MTAAAPIAGPRARAVGAGPAPRAPGPTPAPDEGLRAPDARLVAQVRAQAPLRRALAALLAQLVALRGWERLGFARLRDYAAERLGLSGRQAQELARTGRRLAELPELEAALLAGRLPWTKVRLVARVATAADEAGWIALARRCTARGLAREVRAVDRGALEAGGGAVEEGDAERRACLQLRCTPEVHARWWHARRVAQRVAGERLPREACLEAVVAEALSAVGVEGAAAEGAEREGGLPADRQTGARATGASGDPLGPRGGVEGLEETEPGTPAHALPRPLRALTEGLEEADAFELDARLRRGLALEQRALARLGEALLALVEAGGHRDAGFRTLEAYVRERLGLAPRRARALLRLARAARRSPALAEAWRSGRLSWVRAQAILPVLLPEARAHAGRWVEHALSVSVRRLDEDVEHALLLREEDPRAFAASGGLPPPEEVECEEGLPADRQTGARATVAEGDPLAPGAAPEAARPAPAARRETARLMLFGPRDVVRLLRATLCTVRRRLERATGRPATDGEALGAVLSHALATWESQQGRTPAAHRVFERDGWRCTVPGCSSYRNLHDHHVVFRSAGGSDALANRTTLCAWHHLRGVHEGRVSVWGRAPHGLRFALGIRREAPPLARYGPGERLERSAGQEAAAC